MLQCSSTYHNEETLEIISGVSWEFVSRISWTPIFVITMLLIVEDDYFMRTSLRNYLESVGYQVEEAAHAAEAMEKARQFHPWVAVVDIVIPANGNRKRGDTRQSVGLELASQLKQVDPEMGIVILSAHEDRGAKVLDMLRTVRGLVYQVKGLRHPKQLEESIRMAARGDVWIDPAADLTQPMTLADFLLDICSAEERALLSHALKQLPTLTPAERRVVGKVGQALTNKRIARELSVSSDTVETHIHHIYAKLFNETVARAGIRKSTLLAALSLLIKAKEAGK